jgi:hypothetical protein
MVFQKIRGARLALRAKRVSADGAWVDAAVNEARQQVSRGNLEAGRQLLADTRDDYDMRALRLGRLAQGSINQVGLLTQLAAARPDDGDLALWLGTTRIQHAWQVRTGARAKHVSREQFEEFWFLLGGAHEPLTRAIELLPDDPTPWNHLQWRGLGLQVERTELDDVWAELVKRDAENYVGHYSRTQVLCKKWQGSDEELLEFVTATSAEVAPGDPRAALIVAGHLELWATSGQGRTAYFRRPEIIGPITEIADRWITGVRRTPNTMEAHHLFGAAFYLAGDRERARRHLAQVDELAIPRTLPWAYLSNERVLCYLAVRHALGL